VGTPPFRQSLYCGEAWLDSIIRPELRLFGLVALSLGPAPLSLALDARVLFADLEAAGAGKTILVYACPLGYETFADIQTSRSTVIDHLEREHQNAHVGVAYVYCIYNGIHQTAVNLLGSLLRQLAVQNSAMLDDIKSCHKNQRDSRPSLEQISRLLHSQVQKYNTVFIVIDALDECPEAGQVRKHFLAEVRRLRPDVQIMVTSRHLPSIESTFSQDKRLEVRAHEEDVQTFIESRMATRTELSDVLYGHDDVRSIIVATLLKKTHGMSVHRRI
jgi:hypothetical protein